MINTLTCARLNSTRMQQKCLQNLSGKPLIRHTIDFAHDLGYPYYVFTLDDQIKEIASDCKIINEPESLYDIEGNIMQKLIYINKIIKSDFIILLQATSPIRNKLLYQHWIEDFVESTFSCGFSVYAESRKNYKMNGAFFILRKEIINEGYEDIITNNTKMYLDFQGIDIDIPEDFKKAEAYLDTCN